jgi:hypothetical protein
VLALAVAIHSSHIGLFAGVVAFGFVLGIFGHIIRSRTLIITGIMVIGLASTYYALVLEPAGK